MVTTSSLVLDMRKEEELKKGELRKLLEEEIRTKEKEREIAQSVFLCLTQTSPHGLNSSSSAIMAEPPSHLSLMEPSCISDHPKPSP
jgi:hypothetical protein